MYLVRSFSPASLNADFLLRQWRHFPQCLSRRLLHVHVFCVPLWGLKSAGGTGTRMVDLGRQRRLLAWGQVTMADPLNDFDRDNAYAVEVFDVDGVRPGPLISGGRHWGSPNAPSNVHNGAWVGTARRITFRISALHTDDLDVFGTGNIIILE